jgi:hypothetical protein
MKVGHEVRSGRMAPARELWCSHCGSKADHYHHYLGYDEYHWLDVIPLCVRCHKRAEFAPVTDTSIIKC